MTGSRMAQAGEMGLISAHSKPTISLTFSSEIIPTATSIAALPNLLHCWGKQVLKRNNSSWFLWTIKGRTRCCMVIFKAIQN